MKYCGNCGKQLNDEDKICPYCSAEFIVYSAEKEKQMQFEHKKNKKLPKKAIIPIILVVIIIVAVYLNSSGFMTDFKKGYDDAVSELQTTVESSTENTTENTTEPTTEAATETQTTIQNEAAINILDLFSGLEKAKEVLGEETAPVMDVEAYEQHTFGNVKILCIYDTNDVYKITVEYDSTESKSIYKFGDIDGNTTRSQWEEQLGEASYESINEDEEFVYEYSKDFDGQNYYIIITATSNTPETISFIVMQ